MGGEEPARHLPGADHPRRRAELTDARLPVPPIAVLSRDRWRRSLNPGFGRTGPRLPAKPVYLLGTGESVETPMVSQMEDFTSSRPFRVAGQKAFAEAGITPGDVDHLMIYDAPCS